jgi:predicted Rossmann fold nucleotide-binding protein DprA/Smf involved in DNA uptake
VEDVVEEIAPQLLSLIEGLKKTSRRTLPADSSPEAQKVYELVQQGTMQIDEMIQASNLSPAKVSEILLDLEIKGLLAQLPGKKSTVN